MRTTLMALCFALIGCGDDGGGGGGADAPTAPAMITVSGTATKREGTSTSPGSGVLVEGFKNGESAPMVMTMTDAAGMYSITLTTGGVALDGYLKATLSGFLDTYLYPPGPLAENFDGASLNILNTSTLNLLSGTLCGNMQDTAKGVVAMLVVDANRMPVAGAMVSSTPAAGKICYNSGGFPNRNATMTDTDGIAYLLNVGPGDVTVSATATGMTFPSHKVNARAGAFTTTPIEP